MWETDTFGIRVRKGERARNLPRGLWRSPRHMEHSPGEVLSRFSGVTLHGSLGVPPRIRASRDRMDFALDLSIGLGPCSTVRIFAVSRELSSADEIFYLILQIEARRGGMPTRVVVQAILVVVPFQDFSP